MKNKRNRADHSIDGIPQRKTRAKMGDFKGENAVTEVKKIDQLQDISSSGRRNLESVEADFELDFDDLDETERDEIIQPKKHWWRRNKVKKEVSKRRKIAKRTGLIFAGGLLAIGVFLGLKGYLAIQNIIDRDGTCPAALCDSGNPSALRGEGDGRVNIMIVGIGGEGHDGGNLADTIIISSIDPFAGEVAMLSVPRDLYLDIPDYGADRVNAAHAYGEDLSFSEDGFPDGGIGLLQKTLEQNLDIPIHYYVRVDFTAFQQAIDAVDGVDVTLDEPLYDPTFAWEFGALSISEGTHTLDGHTALLYARSRKTSARGDFDRSERQREIILSLKDKVLSLGTFSDPRKIVGLIDAAGSHVRTNIQISEMLRLYEIGEGITEDKVVSVGLDNGANNYLASANIGGAAVLVPKSGDFIEIQEYVRSIFIDGFIRSEAAEIIVLSGAGDYSLATARTTELLSYGYNVTLTDLAPTQDYTETLIYDLSDGSNPFTKELLSKRLDTEPRGASFLPTGIDVQADFLIIVGSDAPAQ